MTDNELLLLAQRAREMAASIEAGDLPAMPAEHVELWLRGACVALQRLALDQIGIAAERARRDAEAVKLKEELANVYSVATSYADQLGLPHPGVRH